MWKWLVVLATAYGCSRAEAPQTSRAPDAPSSPTAPAPTALPISTSSTEARAHYVRAIALLDDRRDEEATALLQKAVSHDPEFMLAHAFLALYAHGAVGSEHLSRAQALLATRSGLERKFGELILARARGDEVTARTLRRELVKDSPGDWRLQFELGEQLYEEERYDEAIVHYQRAVELNPTSSAWNSMGYAHAQLGRFDAAVTALRQYVAVRPQEPNPYDSLGEVALLAGNFEEAEQAFSKAVALSPSFWEAHHGIAQAQLFRGQTSAALASLRKAREVALSDNDRLELLGYQAWAELIDTPPAALATLKTLEAQAKAKKVDAQYAHVPVLRAAMLSELGRHAEALKEVTTALTRLHHSKVVGGVHVAIRRRALLRKIVAEAGLERAADAQKTLTLMVDEAKKGAVLAELRSVVRLSRGMVALARGDKARAISELKQCQVGAESFAYNLESRPEDPYCVYRLAQLLDATGNAAGAQAARENLLKLNLRDPFYGYLRGKLVAAKTVHAGK